MDAPPRPHRRRSARLALRVHQSRPSSERFCRSYCGVRLFVRRSLAVSPRGVRPQKHSPIDPSLGALETPRSPNLRLRIAPALECIVSGSARPSLARETAFPTCLFVMKPQSTRGDMRAARAYSWARHTSGAERAGLRLRVRVPAVALADAAPRLGSRHLSRSSELNSAVVRRNRLLHSSACEPLHANVHRSASRGSRDTETTRARARH